MAVEVGPASLVPVATAGDPDPQTGDELALATGPCGRRQAFDSRHRQRRRAHRHGPHQRAAARRAGERGRRNGLWVAMLDNPAVTGATAGGRDAAEQMYEACKIALERIPPTPCGTAWSCATPTCWPRPNHKFWKDTVGY